jgi:hypothetical protein
MPKKKTKKRAVKKAASNPLAPMGQKMGKFFNARVRLRKSGRKLIVDLAK